MKMYNITTQGNLNLLLTEEEFFRALSRKQEEPTIRDSLIVEEPKSKRESEYPHHRNSCNVFNLNGKCDCSEEPKSECKGDCYFCNPLGWADRNPASTVTTESSEKMRLEHMKNKEPKSTLREETRKLIKECVYVGELSSEKIADKITSLFKDTLLKEIEKYGLEDWDKEGITKKIINSKY